MAPYLRQPSRKSHERDLLHGRRPVAAQTKRRRPDNWRMENLRVFGSLLLVLALTSCAVPSPPEPGGSPARLILDPSLTRRNPAAGVLMVRRDAATLGDECRHRIFLDGSPVADLRPNEVITIYAVPGQHVLRAEQTGSSCHGGNEVAAISERGKGHLFMTADPSSTGTLLTSTSE
jgi:hypothetical protein